jgi:hypothetical protein
VEETWRSYYASIFNPARLKVKAMQAEMPKRYWKNLPEAAMIKPLIANAGRTAREMMARAAAESHKSLKQPGSRTAPLARDDVERCASRPPIAALVLYGRTRPRPYSAKARSGFHAWLNRPPSARSQSDEAVGQQIKASFLASGRTYGARRVWHDLLAVGVDCGLHRIERLMRLQA